MLTAAIMWPAEPQQDGEVAACQWEGLHLRGLQNCQVLQQGMPVGPLGPAQSSLQEAEGSFKLRRSALGSTATLKRVDAERAVS